MTSRDFCYWLQGFFELASCCDHDGKGREQNTLSQDQVQTLKNHLKMVFAHEIDPSHGPKEHQDLLARLHTGTSDLTTKVNC